MRRQVRLDSPVPLVVGRSAWGHKALEVTSAHAADGAPANLRTWQAAAGPGPQLERGLGPQHRWQLIPVDRAVGLASEDVATRPARLSDCLYNDCVTERADYPPETIFMSGEFKLFPR